VLAVRLLSALAAAIFATQISAGARLALAETVQVKITDLAFSPAEITVHAGDKVEWLNEDFISHTATATGEQWDVAIDPNKSASLQMTKAGTFEYFCRVHPNMTGKIIVAPK
jgi:plastocyanin